PDFVAQEFLKNFLIAFANNKPLYIAVREARERLQGLENDFPCASWLPVIYQNPTTIPTSWQKLRDKLDDGKSVVEIPAPRNISRSKSKLYIVLISTVIVALSTIGLRYLGFFEKTELQTFDQMLQLKPKEDLDPSVVVVEVKEEDIQSLKEYPISDNTLAKLLNKLQEYKPQVIGLDIYRDLKDSINKSSEIQLSTELGQTNVIVGCKGKDKKYDPQGVKPPQGVPLQRQGFTDAVQDPDGVARRQILMMQQDPTSDCKTTNSLALQLVSNYLFYKGIKPLVDNDSIKFGSQELKRLKLGRSGAYQTIDFGGIQILINYYNTDSYP
ncbi:MAG: CHASE2 domain-containing protein, partial [Cyanobacteria bacterium J06649_11]